MTNAPCRQILCRDSGNDIEIALEGRPSSFGGYVSLPSILFHCVASRLLYVNLGGEKVTCQQPYCESETKLHLGL